MTRTMSIGLVAVCLVVAGCKRKPAPPPRAKTTGAPQARRALAKAEQPPAGPDGAVTPHAEAKPSAPGAPPDARRPASKPSPPHASKTRVPGKASDRRTASPAKGRPTPRDAGKRPSKSPKTSTVVDENAVYKKRSKRAARHPLAKARRHQYVLYQVGEMLQRQTVVGVTPTRVKIRFQTILKGKDISDSTTETDLEGGPPHRPGADRPDVKHVGKQVLTVAGRRVVCDITERRRLDGSTTRTWRSDDVPLYGVVKVQTIRNGQTKVVRDLIDFGDFWGPDHSR